MALPLALLALVVIGALVAAGFAAALLEQRIGRNTLYAVQAAGAAETGVVTVVAEWESHGFSALTPGESWALPPVEVAGGASYEPTVRRLNGELFLVRVIGTRRDAGGGTLARRELSLTLRRADSAFSGATPVVPLANRAWSRLSP
jgi:hypothetical protein